MVSLLTDVIFLLFLVDLLSSIVRVTRFVFGSVKVKKNNVPATPFDPPPLLNFYLSNYIFRSLQAPYFVPWQFILTIDRIIGTELLLLAPLFFKLRSIIVETAIAAKFSLSRSPFCRFS